MEQYKWAVSHFLPIVALTDGSEGINRPVPPTIAGAMCRCKRAKFPDCCNAHRVHRPLEDITFAPHADKLTTVPAVLVRHSLQQHFHCLFQTPVAA